MSAVGLSWELSASAAWPSTSNSQLCPNLMEQGWVYFHFSAVSVIGAKLVGPLVSPPVSSPSLTAPHSSRMLAPRDFGHRTFPLTSALGTFASLGNVWHLLQGLDGALSFSRGSGGGGEGGIVFGCTWRALHRHHLSGNPARATPARKNLHPLLQLTHCFAFSALSRGAPPPCAASRAVSHCRDGQGAKANRMATSKSAT